MGKVHAINTSFRFHLSDDLCRNWKATNLSLPMFVCVCVCVKVPVRDSVFHQAPSCLFVSSPFHPLISIFLLVFLNCVSWFSMISYFFYILCITKESKFLFITPSFSGNFRSDIYQFFLAYS